MSRTKFIKRLTSKPPVANETSGRFWLARIADQSGLTVSEILRDDRSRRVAWPRQDACLAMRKNTNLSLPQIGRIMKRHPSTILHAIREAEARATS